MPTDLPVCDKSPIGAREQAHTSHRDKGRSTKSRRIWDGTWQDMPQLIICKGQPKARTCKQDKEADESAKADLPGYDMNLFNTKNKTSDLQEPTKAQDTSLQVVPKLIT